jgi:hypothetical protein
MKRIYLSTSSRCGPDRVDKAVARRRGELPVLDHFVPQHCEGVARETSLQVHLEPLAIQAGLRAQNHLRMTLHLKPTIVHTAISVN